jgi:hypothetical protein
MAKQYGEMIIGASLADARVRDKNAWRGSIAATTLFTSPLLAFALLQGTSPAYHWLQNRIDSRPEPAAARCFVEVGRHGSADGLAQFIAEHSVTLTDGSVTNDMQNTKQSPDGTQAVFNGKAQPDSWIGLSELPDCIVAQRILVSGYEPGK